MLNGIAASEGIGIGKVMIIAEQKLEYVAKEGTDVDAELQRYHDAVKAFCDETMEQADAIRKSTGNKEAEILEGHIAIISDPFMNGEIENLIKAGQCAEKSVEQICQMFIDMFSATGDELTMQRATDVKDIRDGIISILLGVHSVKISDAPAGTVIVVKELTPSMTAGIKKENIVGIITETGSQTSHSAILARALEIPAVLSVENATSSLSTGEQVIVDGGEGKVVTAPDEATINEYAGKRDAYLREKRELENYRKNKVNQEDVIVSEGLRTFDLLVGGAHTIKAFNATISEELELSWDGERFVMRFNDTSDHAVGAGRKERFEQLDELRNVRVVGDVSSIEVFVNDGELTFSTRYYPKNYSVKVEAPGTTMRFWELDFDA